MSTCDGEPELWMEAGRDNRGLTTMKWGGEHRTAKITVCLGGVIILHNFKASFVTPFEIDDQLWHEKRFSLSLTVPQTRSLSEVYLGNDDPSKPCTHSTRHPNAGQPLSVIAHPVS
jgi:hypothetical protein